MILPCGRYAREIAQEALDERVQDAVCNDIAIALIKGVVDEQVREIATAALQDEALMKEIADALIKEVVDEYVLSAPVVPHVLLSDRCQNCGYCRGALGGVVLCTHSPCNLALPFDHLNYSAECRGRGGSRCVRGCCSNNGRGGG